MVRSAWPTCVSVFCWLSTWLALRSARSTSGSSGSIVSCTLAGAAASSPSPLRRPRTLEASTVDESRTSGNACALPTKASAMYAPELRGNSDETKVLINDTKPAN